MRVERKGVSRVVYVIVLILVIAVAAVAFYAASAPKSSSTSTPAATTSTASSSSSTTSSGPQSSSQSTTPSFTTSSSSTSRSSTTSSTLTTSSTTSTTSPTATTLSTTSATSSTTSSTTTQTSTCVSTSSSSNESAGQQLVGFYSAYSSMSISFVGTKNGNPDNLNMTYTVVYDSATTFKVNLSFVLNGQSTQATIWIQNNGDVVGLYVAGKNLSSTKASTIVLGYFADLQALSNFALQASPLTAYFHSAGTSTASIGSNSFTVTDYVANTTPESFSFCNGESVTLNTYNVYLGTPSGSSLELVTYANFAATETTSSGTTTLDYTYQVTGLTVA